jgi:hypothetical protein
MSVSQSHKHSATFKDVKEKLRREKRVKKSGGTLAGLLFQDHLIDICNSSPYSPINWSIANGKLKEWQPTGTLDRVTGRKKHVPVVHCISWFFIDRLGTYHVGTKTTHYILLWKHKYTPPPGTSFPTQSNEEVESLIKSVCRSALQSDDSSDSSETKDYSEPTFLPSMKFIPKLPVEEPEQWKLFYDETKRRTFLIGNETIELVWFYKKHGLFVGNNERCFKLNRSKRAFYYDQFGVKKALQDDCEIKVSLVILKNAI